MFLALRILFLWGFMSLFLVANAMKNPKETWIRSLTVEDGLPARITFDVFQDHLGFIWIGTNNGFCRYDGYTLNCYTPENTDLPFSEINTILEDDRGSLWLLDNLGLSYGLRKNVALFDPKTAEFHSIDKFWKAAGILPPSITKLYKKSDGALFIGTEKGAVYCYKDGKLNLYWKAEHSIGIRDIAANEEAVWILTDAGDLLWFDVAGKLSFTQTVERQTEFVGGDKTKLWTYSHYSRGRNGNAIKTDTIFQWTKTGERSILEEASFKWSQKPHVYKTGEHWKYQSEKDVFWYWDGDAGLSVIHPLNGEIYNFETKLSKKYGYFIPTNVFFDNQGKIWVSTQSGIFIIEIQKQLFQRYLYGGYPIPFSMRGLTVFKNEIYANSYSGKIILDPSTDMIYRKDNSQPVPNGLAVINDGDSCLWVSSENSALLHYCPEKEEQTIFTYNENTYPNAELMPRSHWAMLKDDAGKIWLGSSKGVVYLDVESGYLVPYEHYLEHPALAENTILALAETGDSIWIGANSGLYLLEKNKGVTQRWHSRQPAPNFIPTDELYCLLPEGNDIIWLGTKGSGLIRLNTETGVFQQFTTANGLSNNVINAIQKDDYGYLWLTSDEGLMRFNQQNGAVKEWHKVDGIAHEEFNRCSSGKLPDGTLLFGGLNGITAFHPADFQEIKQSSATLHWTKIELRPKGKEQVTETYSSLERLKYDPSLVPKVHFALLDFGKTTQLSYRWKIPTITDTWTTRKDPFLLLEDLPLGVHELTVQGIDANGNLSANDLRLIVEVQMPLYQRILLIVGALGGLLILVLFVFFNQKKETKDAAVSAENKIEQIPKTDIVSELIKEEEEEIIVVAEEEKETPIILPEKEEKIVVLKPKDELWLREVTQIINRELGNSIFTIEDLASELAMSSRQVNRRLKPLVGMTPNKYIREKKLQKAMELLEKGLVSTVAETAYAVGFEKPSYFTKVFEERYGKRPSSFFS